MAKAQIKIVGEVIQVIITADNGEETTISIIEHETVMEQISDDVKIITIDGVQRTYLKGEKCGRR